jgi:hypothetical protein
MPNITGVRVHPTDTLGVVLHETGRTFSHYDDGCLAILDEKTRIALYAPHEWAWVELVHAEPEPEPAQPTIVTSGPSALRVAWDPSSEGWRSVVVGSSTPAERLWAAQSALQDAREASARSCAEHAAAVADAQIALANLKRELGEAA